jgi:hypothetical protein
VSDEILSALVVMRSRSGEIVPGELVTSANIDQYAPDPGAVQAVIDYFAAAGFEVGQPLGISFAITANRSHFESVFGARLAVEETRGVLRVVTDDGLELPLDSIPDSMRDHIHAITFTPPPDFGPTDYWDA